MSDTRRALAPKAAVKYDWEDITRRLRETPEVWNQVLIDVPRSVYSAIMRQRMLALRDRDWRYVACTRNTNGTRADIWMMARPRTEEEKKIWDLRL